MYEQIDGILACRDLRPVGCAKVRSVLVPLHGPYVPLLGPYIAQLRPHVPQLGPHVPHLGRSEPPKKLPELIFE